MGCGASSTQAVGTKWDLLDSRIPFRKDKGDLKTREALFKKFDQGSKNSLTADDCHVGCIKHLMLNDICEKDVGRVSQAAFNASHLLRTKPDATDNVDPAEFRLYLQYLRDFFEYSSIFDEVDKSGDSKISKEEFNLSAPKFKSYGVPISDSDAVFREVDTDKRGTISFAEFCDWASQQELDREKVDRLQAVQAKADAKTREERMARMAKLRERVPTGYSEADKSKRRALFVQFDESKNGKLTEKECYAGAKKHLGLVDVSNNNDVEIINKASFNQAKAAATKPSKDSTTVDENEFNLYLISLRDHHELNEMFIEMDKGDAKGKSAGDRQVTKEEFKRAVPKVEAWGKKVPNADKAFTEVDTDGKGTVSFPEFCAWATKHRLDVEDDDKTKDEEYKLSQAKKEEEANAMKRKEEEDKAAKERNDRSIAINTLDRNLPTNSNSPSEAARRDELFNKFDTKANGRLTLDECAEGCTNHVQLDTVCGKDNASFINKSAFQSAKASGNGSGDTVDKTEFQTYAVALRNNYELNEMFNSVDSGDAKGKSAGDRQVTKEEFKRAVPKVEAWGKKVPDADKAFAEIDTDSKGTVSFPEFCAWANKHHLDIEKADDKADAEQASKDEAVDRDVAASRGIATNAGAIPEDQVANNAPVDNSAAPNTVDNSGANYANDNAAADNAAAEKAAADNAAAEKAAADNAAVEKAAADNAAAEKAAADKAAQEALVRQEEEDLRKAEEEATAAREAAEAAARAQAEAEAAGDAAAAEAAAEEAERTRANAEREAAEADAAKEELEQAKKNDEEKAAELRAEVARRKALWVELRPKFPLDRTKEESKKRVEIFNKFDVDGKGTLSEEECLKGSQDVLGLNGVVADLPALNKRSFATAAGNNSSINKDEFRLYLSHLRNTIEIREMFNDVDSSDDGKITREEYKRAAPQLKQWGLSSADDDASFDAIDKDGKGLVDFDEFAAFAMKHDLDMEREEITALEAARKHADEQAAKKAALTDADKAQIKADTEKRRILWETIKLRLPRLKNKEQNEARNDLFKEFDLAGNGVISFEECKSGCVNILHLDDFYQNLNPIMRRSFYHAATARGAQSDDFDKLTIERVEFRIFLVFIYDYLDLFVRFEELEFTLDDRIDGKMFEQCVPILESWGITLTGTVAENFDNVDEYDVGSVDFDTFADWAVAQHMKAQGVKITMSRVKLNFGKS